MLRTLADLADRFHLPVRSAQSELARPIRWVHTSEMLDPRPWMRGGELLLTTGHLLEASSESKLREYVDRLAEARVAGLGFGIGFAHAAIPTALLRRAHEMTIPVLEIAQQLSFEEILFSVTADLLRLNAADSRRAADGMALLGHAAQSGGSQAVVTVLAESLGAWVVVIDRRGSVSIAVGAGRIHIDDARAFAMKETRRVRHPSLIAFPIGPQGNTKAYLVVGSRAGNTSLTRELARHAATLLDLVYFPNAAGDLSALARRDAVEVLLSAPASLAQSVALRWGLTAGPFAVSQLRLRSRALMLEDLALDWTRDIGVAPLLSQHGSDVTAVLATDALDSWMERVQRAVEKEHVPVRCGIGCAGTLEHLGVSASQARLALEVALADGVTVARFEELPTTRLLLLHGHIDLPSALAHPLQALVDCGEVGDQLLRSLHVFLAENGSWEPAALQLHIHRHTLRRRIDRVEYLTGLSFDRAEDRFVAWVALRALSLQGNLG